jgi:hypothetical protein
MPQLGRNQREWERENLENECGSQKSVREVRELGILPDREFLAFVTLWVGKITSLLVP